ncbi:MAG TPA: biotin/lipoyl-binding protein, partial [Gammaproteobacteria bacterium]
MSRPLRLLLPVAILGGAVAVVAYLVSSRPSAPRPQPQERVWQVQTLAVVPETRAAALTLYGLVETPRRSAPAAPGAAVVAQVPVREGDGFAAGALLLELDPRDFLPALAAARAELDESVALLENQRLRGSADREALATEERLLALAEAAVQRAERLLGQRLGSDAELDAARSARARQQLALTERRHAVAAQAATLRQLEARREHAAARLAEAELALERSRVEAPFAGRVAAVHVAAGDRVQTGTPLLDLYPLADL